MNNNVETGEMIVNVGDAVVYHEGDGSPHNALVTVVYDNRPASWLVNVVYVVGDRERTDPYGRQIARATSVFHKSMTKVHGNYWRFPNEEPNPITKPSET